MKHTKHSNQDSNGKKETNQVNKIPTNTLLSLGTATLCSALAIKMLKKGELAALLALMAIPVTLFCLSKNDKKSCCKY
ncbi:hypothetical protein SAMN05192529_109120 [Arachidicoccus rhizosphaerae]|jgi:hypothetical protein|uniref:Uncharacterized protein n=1 Tax=Arachidicoccus rhizosphaerae TaxID=551991 RepID=A0A1H3YY46_9BACT|nr:hypothetical protein [Arachidicoccus rhizosphaerae]SEA16327.1 hypothetical protein SAMN05192529_109120 [Arachidicoccus rhizosphaerae]